MRVIIFISYSFVKQVFFKERYFIYNKIENVLRTGVSAWLK